MSEEIYKAGEKVFVATNYLEGWYLLGERLASDNFACALRITVDGNYFLFTDTGREEINKKYPSLHRTDFEGNTAPPEPVREIDWEKVPKGTDVIFDDEGVPADRIFLASWAHMIYTVSTSSGMATVYHRSYYTFPEDFIVPGDWYES